MDAFPCGVDVTVRFEDMPKGFKDAEGLCVWSEDESKVLIRVSKHLHRSAALYTLMHEWVHARLGIVDHGDDFYLELGRIERHWLAEGSTLSLDY